MAVGEIGKAFTTNKAFGKRVVVPSAITGANLDYFVPYPMGEVASAFQKNPAHEALPNVGNGGVLLLFSILSGIAPDRKLSPDPTLCKLHVAVANGRRALRTADDLIRLGNDVSPGSSGLRRQLAFGGGLTPSKADVLYPPSSELPALVESMGAFLQGDLRHWHAADLAAFVCEYAVQVHPFADGNGRWARLLAVEAVTCPHP